jgi:O-antigen/teichoic acid export membrane protein
MDNNEIKTLALSSVVWKFIERIGAQLVSFVVSIILARLLAPEDFSTVGIISIFFAIANVLISGGFNSALIQKKHADEEDFSIVLYVSVAISLIIYLILFFIAPYIAQLYEQENLILMIRIMGISLPITAIKSIWCAYISSTLQFKKFFFATIGGTIVSAFVGIFLAYNGAGAWALIAQQMTNIAIDTIILVITTRLHLVFKLSFKKLKILFNYGGKVFASSIIGQVYLQTVPLVIGVKYNALDLSFYTKGRSFPDLITATTTNTFSAVLFPTLAKVQDEKQKLLNGTRLFIRVTSFFMFPLMLGLFAVAENFVIVLLTEKWLPAVPYIRIFCLSSMFEMVHAGNCETIKAMGKSGVYLIMEIIKKTGYFLTIASFLFLTNSPQNLALAFIVCTVIAIIVNSIPNIKLLGYKLKYQIMDMIPNLLTSTLMCIVVYCLGMLTINSVLLLLIQILVGIVIYLAVNLLIGNSSLIYVCSFIKEKIINRRRKKV